MYLVKWITKDKCDLVYLNTHKFILSYYVN